MKFSDQKKVLLLMVLVVGIFIGFNQAIFQKTPWVSWVILFPIKVVEMISFSLQMPLDLLVLFTLIIGVPLNILFWYMLYYLIRKVINFS